jgi:hypothetical protein
MLRLKVLGSFEVRSVDFEILGKVFNVFDLKI